MRENDFFQDVLRRIESVRMYVRHMPVNLGGSSGSGGGNGGPPGGFVGQLPQGRVTGDTDEKSTFTSGSIGSLIDNLNNLRYWGLPARQFQLSTGSPPTAFGRVSSGSWHHTSGAAPLIYSPGAIGGQTPDILVPSSGSRFDLLTITTGGVLSWTRGAEGDPPSMVSFPASTSGSIPLWVVLARSTGSALKFYDDGLSHYVFRDVRPFLDFGIGGSGTLATIPVSTYSTVQEMHNIFHSSGFVSGGAVTDGGSNTVDVAAGTGLIRATDSGVAELPFFDWPAVAGLSVPADTIRYVVIEYNGGTPQATVSATDDADNRTTFAMATVVAEGSTLHITFNPDQVGDHAQLMIERSYRTMPFARDMRSGGIILGETGTRNVTVSAGTLWDRLNEFTISAIDTSGADTFDIYYQDGGGDWTKVAAATQWPNTAYDDGDGTLGSTSPNRYANLWFYIEADGELVMLYGQTSSVTLAAALEESPPASLPLRLQAHGKLIGRILFQHNDSTAQEIQSAFTTTFDFVDVGAGSSGSSPGDWIDNAGDVLNFAPTNVLTVGPNGQYPEIQDAVDASSGGEIILVAPGTYSDPVDISSKNLSIVGLDRDRCIIDAGAGGALAAGLVVRGNSDARVANLVVKCDSVGVSLQDTAWMYGWNLRAVPTANNTSTGFVIQDASSGYLEHCETRVGQFVYGQGFTSSSSQGFGLLDCVSIGHGFGITASSGVVGVTSGSWFGTTADIRENGGQIDLNGGFWRTTSGSINWLDLPNNIRTVGVQRGSYPTITEALADTAGFASVSNPVTILVSPGTYEEDFTIGNYQEVVGVGRRSTIIKGKVTMNGTRSVLGGMRVQPLSGTALALSGGSPYIENTTLRAGSSGSTIDATSGTPFVRNSSFSNGPVIGNGANLFLMENLHNAGVDTYIIGGGSSFINDHMQALVVSGAGTTIDLGAMASVNSFTYNEGTLTGTFTERDASKVWLGQDVELYRNAANQLRTPDAMRIDGQLTLPTAGASAGILMGGDVPLFRSAANTLQIGDNDGVLARIAFDGLSVEYKRNSDNNAGIQYFYTKSRLGVSADDNDFIADIAFAAFNSADARTTVAKIQAKVLDVTDGSEDGQLFLQTMVAGTIAARVTVTAGVQIGAAPTGGDQGVGTINTAADIYKNNTAFTNPDWVLEEWARGEVVQFAKHVREDGLGLTFNEVELFARTHLHLPGVPHERGVGIFERGDIVLEWLERLFIYIADLNQRIKDIE